MSLKGRVALVTGGSSGILGRPLMAPSALPAPDFASPQLMPHEMDTEEVEGIVKLFGAASRRVREGHMDGVEIAAGMGYLIAEFLHQDTNRRTDKYGGAGDCTPRALRCNNRPGINVLLCRNTWSCPVLLDPAEFPARTSSALHKGSPARCSHQRCKIGSAKRTSF